MAETSGWDSAGDAEYVVPARLQADPLVALDQDLEAAACTFVRTATIEALLWARPVARAGDLAPEKASPASPSITASAIPL